MQSWNNLKTTLQEAGVRLYAIYGSTVTISVFRLQKDVKIFKRA